MSGREKAGMTQRNDIKIKNMEHYEIPYVAAIENRCFSVCTWSETMFKNTLDSADNYIMLTAYFNDMLAGYIVMSHCLDEAEIMVLAVDEPFRRKGIADMLIRHAEDIIKDITARILLEVRESNIPAQNLYLRNRFEKTGLRKNYYSDFSGQKPENAVLMTKYIKKMEML